MDLLYRSFLLFGCWFLVFFVPSSLTAQDQQTPFVVVLDAGHGGKDSGNRGNGYFEKHIALSITLRIGEMLSKQSGFKVIYTRDKDQLIALLSKTTYAREQLALVFDND